MRRFNFKVVRSDGTEEDIPQAVGEAVVEDVQRLLSDVGALMIRRELRTQGDLPGDMVARFTLKPGEASGERGDETLLDDALALACDELDRAALFRIHPEAAPNHVEAAGMRAVARDVLDLADDLEGYSLYYGVDDGMRKFKMNARESLEAMASGDFSGSVGSVVGVIDRDPVHQNRLTISNGVDTFPISFEEDAPKAAFPSYIRLGPVIAVGRVTLGEDGRPVSISEVPECLPFPMVNFRRIVTPTKDIVLLNPITAYPGYDRDKGLWTLCQEDLGLEVAKPTWDLAVASFHDYIAFLWETYVESEGPFQGEDLDVHDFLSSLAYPRPRASQSFIMRVQSCGEHHGQEAHIERHRRRNRRGARLEAGRPGLRGRPPGQARPGPPLRGPREEGRRQVPRQDAEGLPLLRGLPAAADARAHMHGQGREARGPHHLPVLREGPPHAVSEGAVT